MKIFLTTACLLLICVNLSAQDINWRALESGQKNVGSLQFGADYGMVAGMMYGRRLPLRHPVFLGVEWSAPFGKNILDDFKTRVSLQGEIWRNGRFSLGVKPGFILRRYSSDIATLLNLGADLTVSAGYTRPKWMFAFQANYDQTIATHVQHHALQENYPGIYNGWLDATGGNFKFGLQGGFTFGKTMLALRVGKVFARNFQDNPTLPFYGDLSVMRRW